MNKQKKPEVVVIIAARMGSERLPGKVVAPIMNRPLLAWMIDRVKQSTLTDKIVVATGSGKENDAIVSLAKAAGIGWFKGSENDVLDRFVGAAIKYQADAVVRVTADCPLVDPSHIDDAIRIFATGKYDFVANNRMKRTVPIGFDVEICKAADLEKINRDIKDAPVHEHVTPYFYEHPEKFRLKVFGPPAKMQYPKWRLTVDTDKDLELIRRIFRLLIVKYPNFSYEHVVKLLRTYPKLLTINSDVNQKAARITATQDLRIRQRLMTDGYTYKPKYKAAIIGLGRVASGYDCDQLFEPGSSHAGGYQTHPKIQLVAGCDVVEEARGNFVKRWGEVKVYEKVAEMLAAEKPDIVSITTKPDQHYPMMLAAIDSGVKAILCEKPFTDNLKKAEEIVRRCKHQKIALMIDYNRRFDRMHQEVKQALNQEKFGQLLRGVVYYSNGFTNNGSHAIDLVRMFAGEVEAVQTLLLKNNGIDLDVDAALHLKSGGVVVLMLIESKEHYEFEFDGQYQQGRIRILGGGELAQLYRSEVHPQVSVIKQIPNKPNKQWNKSTVTTRAAAIATLVDIMDGKVENPANGDSGIMVHKIIGAVKRSYQTGKTIWLN